VVEQYFYLSYLFKGHALTTMRRYGEAMTCLRVRANLPATIPFV
jgi:hypothetical protein